MQRYLRPLALLAALAAVLLAAAAGHGRCAALDSLDSFDQRQLRLRHRHLRTERPTAVHAYEFGRLGPRCPDDRAQRFERLHHDLRHLHGDQPRPEEDLHGDRQLQPERGRCERQRHPDRDQQEAGGQRKHYADGSRTWSPARLLGETPPSARSAGPTLTARTRTRASSPAPPAPSGVAVDAGHVYWTNFRRRARSAAPTWTGRARTRASSPAPQPGRGGGRRRPRLLDELQHRHDRPRQPRRHRASNQSFITGANVPATGSRSTPVTSTGPTTARHDRPRQPGRHRRRTRASSPAPRPRRGRGRRRPRLLDQRRLPARSAGPTWTAPASTRASSPAPPTPPGWRSTPATSTGPTSSGTIGRADLDGTDVEPELHHRRVFPVGVAVDSG